MCIRDRQAMMLTVRKVFPAAKLINDRFHVLDVYKRQLMYFILIATFMPYYFKIMVLKYEKKLIFAI